MGRIARKGFEYYRAETDRFRDIKIRKLRKKHSCAGYAVYQYVLNEIYRVEGYFIRFTEEEVFDCAEYWYMDDAEVLRIVNYMADTGLFDASVWQRYGILTSRSIQTRYVSMCHAAKRKPFISGEINLLSGEKESSIPVSPVSVPAEAVSTSRADSAPVLRESAEPLTAVTATPSVEPVTTGERILPEKTAFLPEESAKVPEESPIKKRKENISSSDSFNPLPEKPDDDEDTSLLSLKSDLKYLNLRDDQIRWACMLKSRYPEMNLEYAIAAVKDSIRNGDYRYSVGGCITPLIENYIRKYNAESSGEKRVESVRDTLCRWGIPPAKQQEIFTLSGGNPGLVEALVKEVERSRGRIVSPLCFLMSRLSPVKTS